MGEPSAVSPSRYNDGFDELAAAVDIRRLFVGLTKLMGVSQLATRQTRCIRGCKLSSTDAELARKNQDKGCDG